VIKSDKAPKLLKAISDLNSMSPKPSPIKKPKIIAVMAVEKHVGPEPNITNNAENATTDAEPAPDTHRELVLFCVGAPEARKQVSV
jgi:hypothetical protein